MSEEQKKPGAIVRATPVAQPPLVLHGAKEFWQFAQIAAESGCYGIRSPQQAMVILARGTELGLPAGTALGAMHIINGKLTLSARGKVAVVKSRPDLCAYFREVEASDTHAVYETQRVGQAPERERFDLAEAERAGLMKNDNWKKWPKAMCRARASANLADRVYEDVLAGLATREVMEDVAAEADDRAPPVDPLAPVIAAFDAATDREGLQKAAAAAAALGLAKGSFDHARILRAYTAAKARVGEGPKPPGGGAPRPEAPAPERPAADVAAPVVDGEFVESPAAWSAHLAAERNEFAVAHAFLKRVDVFERAQLLDERYQQAAAELRRRGIGDPASWLQRVAEQRRAA